MNVIKLLIIQAIIINLLGCSSDEITEKDSHEAKIEELRNRLTQDYLNKKIRDELITYLFNHSRKLIQEGKLQEAENILAQVRVYNINEEDSYNKKHAEILTEIGKAYLAEDVLKGKKILNKAISLRKDNQKAKDILTTLRTKEVAETFSQADSLFKIWLINPDNSEVLFKAEAKLANVDKSLLKSTAEYEKLKKEILKKKLVYENSNDLFNILFDKVFYNNATGILAINIIFGYNADSGYRAVFPDQFKIISQKGKIYQAISASDYDDYKGYKGLLRRRRVDAGRTTKALILFDVGRYNTKFTSLQWQSTLNEKHGVIIPEKDIRNLDMFVK